MPNDDAEQIEYLNALRENIKESYRLIQNPVFCECLQSDVYFNAQGFHHLENDGAGKTRTIKERIYKLRLFPLAIPTIKNATEIHENKKVNGKISRKKNSLIKEIEYWSLVANVGKNNHVKVKVILRKVGNGQIIFWSIMRLNNKKHQE